MSKTEETPSTPKTASKPKQEGENLAKHSPSKEPAEHAHDVLM